MVGTLVSVVVAAVVVDVVVDSDSRLNERGEREPPEKSWALFVVTAVVGNDY